MKKKSNVINIAPPQTPSEFLRRCADQLEGANFRDICVITSADIDGHRHLMANADKESLVYLLEQVKFDILTQSIYKEKK